MLDRLGAPVTLPARKIGTYRGAAAATGRPAIPAFVLAATGTEPAD
ncbi:hypothetical protein GCM10012275_45160 [Longimycelium tulufanense]|uniref:Uncharacterized protein n=1 Tax=Longimycelium tulufanense TaxID=907463 RepID=A0A8J3CFY4_9PSEU|nr:hypothetical protein GCM10012275_45160 [Longimycelium tulufanense]